VIACIHGACVGGGVDLVCAADVRFASADATFVVKEVEVGLAADLGTLQRLPRLVGNDSLVRELAFTARPWPAEEAARHGFVSAVLPDRDAMRARAMATAQRIAALSPVAVSGTKAQLNYSRGRPVADGLAFAAAWNSGMLQTGDIAVSAARLMGGGRGAGAAGAAAPDDFPPLG
jgi:enoyl-CoA hydratase/carnithine racemase